ncbi:MAG TPA: GNAT family N-acyltransferase [Tepidisphaeraceae bacterium]|nr:GNAT family N-acyltransferase [Tepidisphaeraceae bacterium]
MDATAAGDRLFALDRMLPAGAGGWTRALAGAAVRGRAERLLGFDRINATYARCSRGRDDVDARTFLDAVVDDLGVTPIVSADDLERVPKAGPVVVVANHPFGGIDGILLAQLLLRARPDVRVMANYLLARIPPFRELFVPVDPFGTDASPQFNRRGLKATLDHLRGGGMLAVFPAGEVAHYDVRRRRVVESPWSDTIARLVRKTGANVLPIYFDGQNSTLFQAAGLVHPLLRTALLGRELYNKRGRRIEVRVGRPVPHRTLRAIACDTEMTAYLRLRTSMLRNRTGDPQRGELAAPVAHREPVAAADKPELIAAEVAALPAEQLLVDGDDQVVYYAHAQQIPRTLREIGRLREVAFRAAGEGSGKAIDLDEFDAYYLQLFIWNKAKREVVGGYRLGRTDDIVKRLGKRGLYTSTLFKYRTKLLVEMGPSLEMGRSFVRPEYQRSYGPLLALWKAIATYVARHPKYKNLFGPVSITNDYHGMSRQVLVQFLRLHEFLPAWAKLVRPRNPFWAEDTGTWGDDERLVRDVEQVADLVNELEPDQKGVPVLIRQYLKMGGKLLGFNVDPDFCDVVDGLIMVDLTKTDPRVLGRYMTVDGVKTFRAWHGLETPSRTAAAVGQMG